VEKQLYKAEFDSKSPARTMQIGKNLAKNFPKGGVFCLYGDLGAGKTVFAKGFATGLGVPDKLIKSPTYTLLRTYTLDKGHLYHFDFYRLESADDLLAGEIEEIFNKDNVWIIIEWAERIKHLLPKQKIDIYLTYIGEQQRKIQIK